MMTMGSGSAATRVEKATSHLLIGPDWALNMDICDMINIDRWQTKEVVKAIKKRLQNKHPKVQFLTLMLLETMMKNCGDPVRFEVAQHEILQEMTKIVRKQTDFNVRDKALILLDSWQEAFGGPNSQFPQYYWAYIELKRTGVQFPRRLPDAPLTFTNATSAPPSNYQNPNSTYQNPNFQHVNDRSPTETSNMSLTELNGIKSGMELLNEMLRAINPNDRIAIKDEIITDLVTQCRSNQKKIIQLVNSTGDEALLAEALALNDSLQNVIERHDSIASGSVPLQIEPSPVVTSSPPVMTSSSTPPVVVPAPVVEEKKKIEEEEEEEDDEFAELARRKSKGKNIEEEASSSGVTTEESSSSNKIIVPIDLPPPSKQQDMIDLLTLALYDPPQSSDSPSVTSSVSDSLAVVPVSSPVSPPITQQPYNYNPYNNNPYNGNSNNVYNSNPYNGYVASWAQPAQPVQPPAQQQYYNYPNNPYTSSYPNNTPQNNPYNPSYPNNNSQFQQYNSFPSNAAPPQVNNNNNPMYSNPYSAPAQPMQRFDSFGNNSSVASVSHQMDRMGSFGGNNNIGMNSGGGGPALKKEMNNAPKPYYMPDNLFGDLIDLKSNKQTGTGSGQSMVNGKK